MILSEKSFSYNMVDLNFLSLKRQLCFQVRKFKIAPHFFSFFFFFCTSGSSMEQSVCVINYWKYRFMFRLILEVAILAMYFMKYC